VIKGKLKLRKHFKPKMDRSTGVARIKAASIQLTKEYIDQETSFRELAEDTQLERSKKRAAEPLSQENVKDKEESPVLFVESLEQPLFKTKPEELLDEPLLQPAHKLSQEMPFEPFLQPEEQDYMLQANPEGPVL